MRTFGSPAFSASATLTALLGLAIAVLPASLAEAHNYAVATIPATGATLTTLPDQFVITTNENFLDLGAASKGFAIEIVDAVGKYYGDGCVAVAGPKMSTRAAVGAAGSYTVIWQGVSVDGHLTSAKIPFTWNPRTGSSTTATEGSETPPVCGAERPAPSAAVTTTLNATTEPSTAPSTNASTPIPTPSASAVPIEDSPGDASRAETSANTLLTVSASAAALLVLIVAVILRRRRNTRKRLHGAPDSVN